MLDPSTPSPAGRWLPTRRPGSGRRAEVAVGHRLRSVYRRLSDRDLDWIVAAAAQPWAQRLISRLGDIDFPAQLLSALLHDLPRNLHRRPWLPGLGLRTMEPQSEFTCKIGEAEPELVKETHP